MEIDDKDWFTKMNHSGVGFTKYKYHQIKSQENWRNEKISVLTWFRAALTIYKFLLRKTNRLIVYNVFIKQIKSREKSIENILANISAKIFSYIL